ncbi:MAG: hypothetical protein ACI9WU_001483, partial [Myxococcota bacterium]
MGRLLMEHILSAIIACPLLAFVAVCIIPGSQERA